MNKIIRNHSPTPTQQRTTRTNKLPTTRIQDSHDACSSLESTNNPTISTKNSLSFPTTNSESLPSSTSTPKSNKVESYQRCRNPNRHHYRTQPSFKLEPESPTKTATKHNPTINPPHPTISIVPPLQSPPPILRNPKLTLPPPPTT